MNPYRFPSEINMNQIFHNFFFIESYQVVLAIDINLQYLRLILIAIDSYRLSAYRLTTPGILKEDYSFKMNT